MPRPALTRFHLTAIAAVLLGGGALLFHQIVIAAIVAGIFLTAVGLGAAFPQFSFFGPFVCRGDGSRRVVALTFDDGPDARSTPALLDLLREKKIAVAFFCIGKNVAAHPELTARILREGHLLENHTYHHSWLTNIFTVARLREEMRRTQEAIRRAAGVAPKCFRPPMGYSNPRVFRAARESNLKMVGWTARGLDTQITNPERIVRRIARRLEPGAIILLHDGNIPAERLIATVKLLLDTLRTLGYEVVRLDQILT